MPLPRVIETRYNRAHEWDERREVPCAKTLIRAYPLSMRYLSARVDEIILLEMGRREATGCRSCYTPRDKVPGVPPGALAPAWGFIQINS